MAKNYTFSEAVAIIAVGKDMEAIQDLGRRYPILVQKVSVVATKAGAEFVELMSFMPEYLTANKVNTVIKNAVFGDKKEADESDEDIDETTEDSADSAESTDDADYESMSAKKLWDILGKAGKRKLAKSTKKADLVEACKAMDAGASDDAEEVDSDTEEAETSENPYEGKSAMDLFKECKKRGIKVAPKKPAKFYADLLIKADASTDDADEAEAESDDDANEAKAESDDWDEEEAHKEEKKTADKKADKKATKPAKKAEAEAEGDDDWDI